MSETSELLATLRDIGEPPPPDGVPPALVLANVALAVLLVGTVVRRRRRRRRAWRDAALAELRAVRGHSPEPALLAYATLLRRVMRRRHGPDVDALQGDAWLARLDEVFGGDWFTRGDGRVFGDALYAPDAARELDVDALGRALTRHLKRLPDAARPTAAAAAAASGRTHPDAANATASPTGGAADR